MPPQNDSSLNDSHAVMFVAPNFDAQEFVEAYYQLRRSGCRVTTVGVRAGAIQDRRGLQIAPDKTVSGYIRQMGPIAADAMVILGESDCVRPILTDPRVVRLIENATEAGRSVYCSHAAQQMLLKLGINCTAQQFASLFDA